MITLALLHPTQHTTLRSWTFESEPVVRIGRSQSNDVVIASAVVSRHHVELWYTPPKWEVISYGANGTYVEGQPIYQTSVVDGMVICLGRSGPQIQIQLSSPKPKT